MTNILDRVPPRDLSAEQAVVGSVLISPSVLDELAALGIRSKHFYDDANRQLYDTLELMHNAGMKIDGTLLRAELQRLDRYEAVGGAAGIARIVDNVPVASHAVYYADIVMEHARQRHLIEGATRAIASVKPSAEMAAELSHLVESIEADSGSQVGSLEDACIAVMESLRDTTDSDKVVKTGIRKLDESLTGGGLNAGQLTIIAAATSVGKTALALEIADNAAKAGKRVLYCTFEMSAQEVVRHRLLPRYDQTSKSSEDALKEISELPIHFLERPTPVAGIRGVTKIEQARDGVDLLVIDYLGLVPAKGRDAYERTTAASRELMTLPKELDIPVLVLSQVNRESSKGEKMTCPRLDQLRDSGAIEQDSHNVLILHRESRHDHRAELFVAKQRNGVTGKFKLEFDLSHQRFLDEYAQRGNDFAQYGAMQYS